MHTVVDPQWFKDATITSISCFVNAEIKEGSSRINHPPEYSCHWQKINKFGRNRLTIYTLSEQVLSLHRPYLNKYF